MKRVFPSYLRTAAMFVLLASLLFAPGCIKIVKTVDETTPVPINTSAPPEQAAAAPTPTPFTEYDITFTAPGNSAVQQYMQLALCAPIADAAARFGEPTSIYGQGSYAYRAIAGADDTEGAIVYRFSKDNIGFECIASAVDGRILKKQVSTPAVFPKLLDNASGFVAQDNTPYSQLLDTVGINPYLWMAFLAPNAVTDADRYEVCLWPDSSGQLVAVVQNNMVLRCEYQPNSTVLPAAAVDGVTPRVPRYLARKPKNGNDALAKYEAFKKFASIKPGQDEDDVRSKMGEPTSTEENSGMRTMTYTYADAAYATGETVFTFTVTGDDATLIAKGATAMPLGETEIRGRYAPQMLHGMTLSDIERFMGDSLLANQSLSTTDVLLNAYAYTGCYASVSAVFAKDTDTCLWHELTVNDTQEEAVTLYEEYVLPVVPGSQSTPRKTAKPTPTPPSATRVPVTTTPTPPLATRVPLTPKPTPTLFIPSFSMPPITIIPRITPTPIIIR